MNTLRPIKHVSDFLALSAAPVDEDGAHSLPPELSQDIRDIEQMVRRGPAFTAKDLPAYIDAAKNLNGPGIDDRKFLLEKLVTLMSRLPDDSTFANRLQSVFVDVLYKDLPHPPSGYLALPRDTVKSAANASSQAVKYAFRSADGSNYNPLLPSLGKAGSPYARSVPSTHPLPPSFLPDPGLVFDTLLKRDEFVPHPGGISSLFFAFADLVIHSIFNTNAMDWTINDASSYLDLSPLYGSSDREVDSVRRKDGTGRLWNDVFADNRLLFMPPSACALLVLFCRNHNYVADMILKINENRTYSNPAKLDDAARHVQDEEIFQRSRLVNTCLFMQVILGDYVAAILGLVRDGSAWRLNPLETMRELSHEFAPQGEGNAVSVEFNLLYRWHATSSIPDEQFISNLFNKLFDGKDFSKIGIKDFKGAVYKYLIKPSSDIKSWTFGDLKRDEDGSFRDDDLAKLLQDATESSASAFKARGIPEALRVIEILGIEQARSWGTCSLNEFRKFIGLRPYADFKEWNPDPKVYVGLQAEEAKIPMPGAGLCPGYTISRAILADAVCLTRGDRFLTVDFTPFNLTSWGYQDCLFDRHDGSYGGMLTKLLFRALPQHYPAGCAYAHFPFMVPARMKEYMSRLPDSPVDSYVWSRPVKSSVTVVRVEPTVTQVLSETEKFSPLSDVRLADLFHSVIPDRASVRRVMFNESEVLRWSDSFKQLTQQLIRSKSIELDHVGTSDKYVDIVRDVINLVPVYWVADQIAGLPMKTLENPRGEFREQALFGMFADAANYLYLDLSPVHDFSLRVRATNTANQVCQYIRGHLTKLSEGTLSSGGIADTVKHWIAGANDHSNHFLAGVLAAANGSSPEEIAAGIFAEVVATTALYSNALAHVVDYYLDDQRRDKFVQVISSNDKQSEDETVKAVREALRECKNLSLSVLQCFMHNVYTEHIIIQTAYQILKVIFLLADIKRVSGQSGQMNQLVLGSKEISQFTYINANGEVTPWPVSLVVQYKEKV
ncbi:heme peroxidase [Sparassis latifolia]